MITDRPVEYLVGLVNELCKLPQETAWVEFKKNNDDPREIGEYISALANSTALVGKASGYLVWGVEDASHAIVGTTFAPSKVKVGNEELENWLLRLLEPKIEFGFFQFTIDGKAIVVLEIERAYRHPVRFKEQEFIRIGSYKKKLRDFPEKERELWRFFDRTPFEAGVAIDRASVEDILKLLDYSTYFELLRQPLPENRIGIVKALETDRLVRPCTAGGWSVTNLGAILFARQLEEFPSLQRRQVRVVLYRGTGRVETQKELVCSRGYACGFEELLALIDGLLPTYEMVDHGLRKTESMFPVLVIRELIANALIHQDFLVTGTCPMVEIFDDRIEITNPGAPLVDTMRFVDTPPRSRNEQLASLMRRIGICEERGSGWDKIATQTELFRLPAPLAEIVDDHTRVILFAPRPLLQMESADRVRAVYLHACLRYVNREDLTNTSVRTRFGIELRNSATASRLIKEAVRAGVIAPVDPFAPPKLMRYWPVWAASQANNVT